MNGLYPIIRRVRRPLLPVEAPAQGRQTAAKPAGATPAGPGGQQAKPGELGKQQEGKETHGEAIAPKPPE